MSLAFIFTRERYYSITAKHEAARFPLGSDFSLSSLTLHVDLGMTGWKFFSFREASFPPQGNQSQLPVILTDGTVISPYCLPPSVFNS